MAFQKNIEKAAKITEIRIRELNPSTAAKLGVIAKHYHEGRGSVLVEKVINEWQDKENMIEQLQKRNTELHTTIAKYHSRENEAKQVLYNMTQEMKDLCGTINRSDKRLAMLLKQYTKRPPVKKSKPSPKKKK